MVTADSTRLQGQHCAMIIESRAPAVVLITIEGTDVGELGAAPFRALEQLLANERIELFID